MTACFSDILPFGDAGSGVVIGLPELVGKSRMGDRPTAMCGADGRLVDARPSFGCKIDISTPELDSRALLIMNTPLFCHHFQFFILQQFFLRFA
jgi:hypothetical protein